MGLNRTWHITIVWQEIMKSMPMKPDVIMQKSLLGACKIHRNFDLGKKAGLEVIELAPDAHASYVLLSTFYAMANKWDQVPKLRKSVLEKGIKKPPGCSSIEVDGLVHEFIVGDTKHHRSKEISEKLAVAFGLISTKPGTTVRATKNVHMCSDCHSALKLLSIIYDRDLIILSNCRFYVMQRECLERFKTRSCSAWMERMAWLNIDRRHPFWSHGPPPSVSGRKSSSVPRRGMNSIWMLRRDLNRRLMFLVNPAFAHINSQRAFHCKHSHS